MADMIAPMDIDDISAELNKSAKKYRKELFSLVYLGLGELRNIATGLPNCRGERVISHLLGKFNMRPYENRKFDKLDGMDFRTLKTYLGSSMGLIDPNMLRDTLWGSLESHTDNIPDAEFRKKMLMLIMGQIIEDLALSPFNAKRNPLGNDVGSLYSGYDTIANEEIVTEKISVSKGNLFEFKDVINEDNIMDALKDYHGSLHPVLKGRNINMLITYDLMDMYNRAYADTRGGDTYVKGYEQTKLEGTNGKCTLVPIIAKDKTQIIQATTKDILAFGYGKGLENEKVEIRRGDDPHLLQVICDMWFGAEYTSINERVIKFGKLHADQWKPQE